MVSNAYYTLAERLKYPNSKYLLRLLEVLITPQEAETVISLPASTQEIASKLGLKLEVVKQKLTDLYQKGILFPSKGGYVFACNILQLHDATQCDSRHDAYYGQKLFDAWEDFCQNEWYPDYALEEVSKTPRSMRVIPIYKAIKYISGVQPWEDIRLILRKYEPLAVVPCPCRRQTKRCNRAIDVCLQLGSFGKYAINRGNGRQISYKEALSIIDVVENDGLIHRVINRRDGITVICNCCADDCLGLVSFAKINRLHDGDAKSRFEAVVGQDICDGCQNCMERCQYDAMEMVKSSTKKLKAKVNADKCFGCGACVLTCPTEAIKLKLVRPEKHVLSGAVNA